LLREESEQKLDDIATRSDDPELQRTVAECREEVRKARAEAGAILEPKYLSVDE
jgi:hypothetical protein